MTNPNIFEKRTWKRNNQVVTTSINPELWELAKGNNINWNEALTLGLQIKLAELEYMDYPNIQLYKSMMFYQQELEKAIQELNELKQEIKIKQNE